MNLFAWLRNKIPRHIVYIAGLFISTRLVLTVIGVVSRVLLEPFHGKEYVWIKSRHLWLDIWGVWDTGLYLDIAKHWYPFNPNLTVFSTWGFFPFYPMLIRAVSWVVRDQFIASLFISNVCLFVACILLFHLVKMDAEEATALRAVKYLFLFPTAFILSGGFSESLFLFLTLAAFYCARKDNWLMAGVAGFCLSLTRAYGTLIFIPLIFEYMKSKEFNFRNVRLNAAWLLIVPLGLFLFLWYSRLMTGDWLAYVHVHKSAWHMRFQPNPLSTLWAVIYSPGHPASMFPAWFLIAGCVFFLTRIRALRFSYGIFGLCVLLTILFTGLSFRSLLRYLLPIFPFYIQFAAITGTQTKDQILTILLALLQGFLMVFWANGFSMVT